MIYLLYTAVLVYKTLWKFVLSDGFKIEIDEDYVGIKTPGEMYSKGPN